MGVNGLIKIIVQFAPGCITKRKFRYYNGKKVPMDSYQALYKFAIALRNTKHYRNIHGEEISHLFAIFFKTCSMLRYAILPLWVIDGKPPSIKKNTLDVRKKNKESAFTRLSSDDLSDEDKCRLEKKIIGVTGKHIKDIKYLLDLMGLPYFDAPEEAEAQCAAFERSHITNGVATEDWDALLFGCNKMLKNFSNKSDVIEIDRHVLLQKLGMTQEQLIDLGSILGNDYCDGISGLKPTDAYEKFKQCDFDMEKFLKYIKKETRYSIPRLFTEQWKEATNYFINAPVIRPDNATLVWNSPKFDELYRYLVDIKGFNHDLIIPRINELKLMYTYYFKDRKLVTLSQINRELQVHIIDNKRTTYILNYIEPSVPNINEIPPIT